MEQIPIKSTIDPINLELEINKTSFTPAFMGKLDILANLEELISTTGITIGGIEITDELLEEINKALKDVEPIIKTEESVKVYGPNIRARNSKGELVALYAGNGGGKRQFLSKGVNKILGGNENGG